ncbi:MAG: hypothetical protein GC151_10140 [Betaproteobacteria bacterium]|nr:hypothetical protein [Betaproteobacteria bacterium]
MNQPLVSNDAPLFGQEEALQMIGDDHDLLREVVAVAHEHIPLQLDELRSTLTTGDISSAHRHAHTLKGTAATLGAHVVRDRALAIELAAKGGDLAVARNAFETLEPVAKGLVEELDAYLRG